MIFVGDDWAEAHHDVYVCDEAGAKLASKRLPEGVEGLAKLHDLVASHVDGPGEVVVGIETDRGLWVNALVEAGYVVYTINPKAASRYRDRHSLSGAKSDPGDAKMLAELVRTDRHNHRQVAGDTALAEGIKILARAHQSLVWERTRTTNRLRSSLREYFPAALDTFSELADTRHSCGAGSGGDAERGRQADAGQDPHGVAPSWPATQHRDPRGHDCGRVAQRCFARSGSSRGSARATTRSSVAILAELNTQIDRCGRAPARSQSCRSSAGESALGGCCYLRCLVRDRRGRLF